MPGKRLIMPIIVLAASSRGDPSYLVIPFASTSPEYGWAFGGKAHARDLFVINCRGGKNGLCG